MLLQGLGFQGRVESPLDRQVVHDLALLHRTPTCQASHEGKPGRPSLRIIPSQSKLVSARLRDYPHGDYPHGDYPSWCTSQRLPCCSSACKKSAPGIMQSPIIMYTFTSALLKTLHFIPFRTIECQGRMG